LLREQGGRLDDGGREFLGYLVGSARRMRALVHDLLELSRAGRVLGELKEVGLAQILDEVRADLAELIRSKNADVNVIGTLPTGVGDRDRLRQLFDNLSSNGLKFNEHATPRVEVGSAADSSATMATVWVRDNGIGVDPQHHARIFQVFRRLHPREAYEGTGAG